MHISERTRQEDTICVFGLGAIGLFAIQYAKVLGCKKIIAVDINDDKLEVAEKCGATYIVNSLKDDPSRRIDIRIVQTARASAYPMICREYPAHRNRQSL